MERQRRIVIVADNEVGVLAGITRVLADAGVNIEGISAEDTGEQGIIVLNADDSDHAPGPPEPGRLQGRRRRHHRYPVSPTSPALSPGWPTA